LFRGRSGGDRCHQVRPQGDRGDKTGKGHSPKQRPLDLATDAMQVKFPLDAVSIYLNGFHMYADDMGRQVEASHSLIHLEA
jgi:hypothetical protein